MSETAELLTLESAMFSSTYEHTLDAKNRLFIPVKIREAVGDAFYLFAPPREKCLYIYSPERWEEVARAVLSKNDRNYERLIFGSVIPVGYGHAKQRTGTLAGKRRFVCGYPLLTGVRFYGVFTYSRSVS